MNRLNLFASHLVDRDAERLASLGSRDGSIDFGGVLASAAGTQVSTPEILR
ncbi:hypothetical protein [Stieleria marina]|uniref:Uncharacterized protein n=1 Tax=Stieleria marina TaxID=1930275 RepID=A0A517NUR3_9BACT|nr:hypothetical protein K239x_28590 [Planctomycetes bacterium K23_9]